VTRRARWLAVIATLAVAAPVQGAQTRSLHEHVALKLISKSGTHFIHRGSATGTVSGRVRSHTTLGGLSISGVVTVTTRSGTVRLHISGTVRSGGLHSRFAGRATVTGGSGRYAKAHGRGTFRGVVNRATWAATIDASGTLTF
jgi:hypothetical protein